VYLTPHKCLINNIIPVAGRSCPHLLRIDKGGTLVGEVEGRNSNRYKDVRSYGV